MSPERRLAILGVIVAPAIFFGAAASGNKDTKATPADENSFHLTSKQAALDIRNCITTTLPHSPDKDNPFCKDLQQSIYILNTTRVIHGCDNIKTILDTPPTAAQVETLRDCASAAFLTLEKR